MLLSKQKIESFKALNSFRIYLIILGLIAISIRFYKLSHHPLWLDELYGYQLGKLGLEAILLNSLVDPHPPLYYLMQWAASGFDALHNEWSWRWFAALSGSLSPILLYLILNKMVDRRIAFLGALLFAVSPTHIYFSQQSRSTTFDTLLATVSMLLLYKVHSHKINNKYLLAYLLILMIGLYSSYSFVMIAGVQLIYIIIVLKKRKLGLLCALILFIVYLPMIDVALDVLTNVAQKHEESAFINLYEMSLALLGVKYQRFEDYEMYFVSICLLLLVIAGLVNTKWVLGEKFIIYCIMQVVLPILLIFGLVIEILGMNLPPYEFRQFVIILPAFFVLVSAGMHHINRYGNRVTFTLTMTLYVLMLIACWSSINTYWNNYKLYAHVPIQALVEQWRDEDAVVSLHYRSNAFLSFYLPDAQPYSVPKKISDEYMFARTNLFVPLPSKKRIHPHSVKEIHNHKRIWVVYGRNMDDELKSALSTGCSSWKEQNFGEYMLILIEGCDGN
ncbi:MAG: glycosyltransferase family 39 protein [Ardenticatenaceae bacterium]